jgi:hypothetical protein
MVDDAEGCMLVSKHISTPCVLVSTRQAFEEVRQTSVSPY